MLLDDLPGSGQSYLRSLWPSREADNKRASTGRAGWQGGHEQVCAGGGEGRRSQSTTIPLPPACTGGWGGTQESVYHHPTLPTPPCQAVQGGQLLPALYVLGKGTGDPELATAAFVGAREGNEE